MLSQKGLGLTQQDCTGVTGPAKGPFFECMWKSIVGFDPTPIGVAPAPPQNLWTIAPADEASAQTTVDTLINQQLANQQSINADMITSTPTYSYSLMPFDISTYYPLIIGAGVIALVMSGRRRR